MINWASILTFSDWDKGRNLCLFIIKFHLKQRRSLPKRNNICIHVVFISCSNFCQKKMYIAYKYLWIIHKTLVSKIIFVLDSCNSHNVSIHWYFMAKIWLGNFMRSAILELSIWNDFKLKLKWLSAVSEKYFDCRFHRSIRFRRAYFSEETAFAYFLLTNKSRRK